MKTWDEVSKEMQSHGTPLSSLGYCKIAYDAGARIWREAHDAICDDLKDLKTYLVDAQWERDRYKAALEEIISIDYSEIIEGEYTGRSVAREALALVGKVA